MASPTDLDSLTAAILVGGLGTRLRASVRDRPKVLAEVLGRPFLAYLLDQLADAGVRRTVLCTGHLAGLVRDAFGPSYRGMELAYSEEQTPLGTGGALRLALPQLDSDPALALNGDSYCQADLGGLLGFFRSQKAKAALLLAGVPDTSRYGRVAVDETGAVVRFVEKGGAAGPGWINAGIYVLGQEALGAIPENRPVSLEREVYPAFVGRGLYGWQGGGRFIDIGTPESYAEAAAFFAAR
jgi:NDP-sugar pyrophosphorylase family protein